MLCFKNGVLNHSMHTLPTNILLKEKIFKLYALHNQNIFIRNVRSLYVRHEGKYRNVT